MTVCPCDAETQLAAPPAKWRKRRFFDLEILRRGYAEQILHEIIPSATGDIERMRAAIAVKHIGNEEHVERLVGGHQRVDQAHRFNGMDVVVDVTMDEEQMALQMTRDGVI